MKFDNPGMFEENELEPIDIDKIRHTYYDIIQNKYSKKELQKHSRIIKQLFPSSGSFL